MRLAFGLGRTVRELEQTMLADEYDRWITFHRLYDLPDGFLVTGQLGAIIRSIMGEKTTPGDSCPYYAPTKQEKHNQNMRAAFAFAKSYVESQRKAQIPPTGQQRLQVYPRPDSA